MVAKKKTGTVTGNFMPKRAFIILITICLLIMAFLVFPKSPDNLSSDFLSPSTTSASTTTTNCPDANITLEWTANPATTDQGTNPVGYVLYY